MGIKYKTSKKGIILISVAAVLLLAVGGIGILFFEELKLISSIKKLADDKPVYYMEANNDYYFEDFLRSGGAASDFEVSAFLTKKISKGFYAVDVASSGTACSTISAQDQDGSHVWGRNYDWNGSMPIIVKCTPKDGYSSISTCDFQNITGSPGIEPDGFMEKMLSIAALYVPLDGINEAGLCVADLEVNEGGMITADTAKPDLTVTTAIRLLLNKAATVQEAVDLLNQYDIYASGGISHHIAVSDAAGQSAVIEFAGDSNIVVPTNFVTNFNLANGDTSAGGESAKERFETLKALYEGNKGLLSAGQIKDALFQTSQKEGEWITQWSIVYDQNSKTVNYYFYGDYTTCNSYPIGQ